MKLAIDDIPMHSLADRLSFVLCYPRSDPETLASRMHSLRELGVQDIIFDGGTVLQGVHVLGKGHVGVVVKVVVQNTFAAAKIRRVDADRKSMVREAEFLQMANASGVGPRLLACSQDVLLMELVEGKKIDLWLREVSDAGLLRKVVLDVVKQCRRLDEAGLDHGELSKAHSHVCVNAEAKPWILDFETASTSRRPSNVTSVVHYFFLRCRRNEILAEYYCHIKEAELKAALTEYKRRPSPETFDHILREIGQDTKL